ncbi:hypothetical protein MMC30_008798 [Trapelia coarctata]|nr:hypothetical protein [Trapelia coarctata]
MFSSFSSFSFPFSASRLLEGGPALAVNIEPIEVHDVEVLSEKRARTLKHLLKLNHVNHSIVYHHLQFHNHLPHILASAYILGADGEHLHKIYEEESKELEKWQDSPGEVSQYDWRDYLGDRRYQRAYVDFFEDELVLHGYDWRKVLDEYLFRGKEPLINCVIAGLGHPLIHLGYAYEMSSRELAIEALGLATTSYNFLHRYLDDSSYTKPSTYHTQSPMEILERIATDRRFDGIIDHEGSTELEKLFTDHSELLLEHWNAWQISDPKKQFEDSQDAATALLTATQKAGSSSYDFFFVHLLTTCHAVRILLPLVPTKFHISLVRQWWLLTLAVYVVQLRPLVDLKSVLDYDVAGRDWKWVNQQAIGSRWATDAHFVKALRAMEVAASTWGDESMFYIKAAVKFAEGFQGWGGFGPFGEEGM